MRVLGRVLKRTYQGSGHDGDCNGGVNGICDCVEVFCKWGLQVESCWRY